MKADPWAARLLGRAALSVRLGLSLLRLPRHGPPPLAAVRRALRAGALGSLSAPERRWAAEIESLRSRLLGDERQLTVMDFGAGSGDLELTQAEMAAGRPKTLTVAEACAFSKSRHWALLLFQLVRSLRPRVCIEMGTCVGVSAAYQAAALRLNGGDGRLITLEGALPLVELAAGNLKELGLEHASVVPGRFQDTLEGVLRENAPVDFVFVDGHHDELATLGYFAQVVPHLAPGSVVVFDDIGWSTGMARAWGSIASDPRVGHAVDLGAVGLCIVPSGSGS